MNDPMGAEAPVIRRRGPNKKPAKKRNHRPPIAPKAIEHEDVLVQRNSPRPAPRAPARDPNRDPNRMHSRTGGVMVQGRDGTVLTRRRTAVGDWSEDVDGVFGSPATVIAEVAPAAPSSTARRKGTERARSHTRPASRTL